MLSSDSAQSFKESVLRLKQDIIAGFLVSLLALPLSLGIAKASGFPAAAGVLTAIVGGLFSSLFHVSSLTIKGPAAGLITICSGAVIAFGGGDTGWQVAAMAVMVAAVFQMLLSLFKLGSLSDFFPQSAVHGMLAAIGIIIIAKQIPVLLGDDPQMYMGEGPVSLLLDIPRFITQGYLRIGIIGVVGLLIMFGAPYIRTGIFKMIPSPMLVLLITIPLALLLRLDETGPAYSLVKIGDFWGAFGFHLDASYLGDWIFWKFVFMFLFVGSLESLLTVKAVDQLDPQKRASDYDGDLMGVGAGNFFSGLFGGLPMISEVVRSSANIGFGARTKWSNFFHGLSLLAFMTFLIPVIELIPNAALSAMLIFAGFRLAAPRQFVYAYRYGKEQLAIFLLTIVVTLFTDLLLGVFSGVLLEFLLHLYHGARFRSLFKAQYELRDLGNEIDITVFGAAVFSNLPGFKKLLSKLPAAAVIQLDLRRVSIVDHSFMAFVTHFQRAYESGGGVFQLTGLEQHVSLSDHELSAKKRLV